MKTKDVEKVIGRKFVEGKSLIEQTTSAEYAQICFETAVETYILTELSRINRIGTDKEIKERVSKKWQEVLDACGGDYEKAVQRCV